MMRRYEDRTKTEVVLAEIKCDLCGKDYTKPPPGVVDETCIEHSRGEKGQGTITEIDLCGDCFENDLVPWLKSKGVSIVQRGWVEEKQ